MALNRNQKIITCSLCIFLALVFVLVETPIQAVPVFQSQLPTPVDPHTILNVTGGRVYCGLQQSSTWLSIPSGFSSADWAMFHCDPSGSLSGWNGTKEAWNDKGYLIGFWPSDIPIVKSFSLDLEIDPALTQNICNNCFAGYYLSGGRTWKPLPTAYDAGSARVSITISSFLTPSGYPGYEDRFLVALFTHSMATPTSKAILATPTTPTTTPGVTPTVIPRATSTEKPTQVPTSAVTPTPPPTTQSPTPTETDLSSTPSITDAPAVMTTPTTSQPKGKSAMLIVVIILAIVVLVLAILAVVLFAKRNRGNPYR